MRLSDYTDYSLRVLIYLNRTKETSTLDRLAKSLAISRNNLIQISSQLSKLGYIEASRGPGGGLKIRESAGKARIGEIVQKTEQTFHMAQCFTGGNVSCPIYPQCVLKECLQEALGAFVSTLDKYNLNDISLPHKTRVRKRQ